MKITFRVVFDDGTHHEFIKEHTGNEFNELIATLQQDGCTITVGTYKGVWHPYHSITRIEWKQLK